MTTPLLVLAEFGCSETGDAELRAQLERTLAETRAVEAASRRPSGSAPPSAATCSRPTGPTARPSRAGSRTSSTVRRSCRGFRRWCIEGGFSEFTLAADHDRARKCASCGRWTQGRPGWSEHAPSACRQCSEAFTREPVNAMDSARELAEAVRRARASTPRSRATKTPQPAASVTRAPGRRPCRRSGAFRSIRSPDAQGVYSSRKSSPHPPTARQEP